MDIGTCLACFVENVKVCDIAGSQLQYTYEQITHFKIQNVSYYLCNICHTRLQQFNVLFKHISNNQNCIEDQSDEVDGQTVIPLSSHVIERGSIPYHVNVEQQLVITIKKEEGSNDTSFKKYNQPNLARREMILVKHSKKSKRKTKRANKTFTCDICNKQYGRSDHLKLHKMCHTNDTPYSCDACKKNFKRKSNLKDHMKTHTNDKPHKCDICSKTFLKGSNLKAHKLTHTHEKPFKCDTCSRTFNRKSHLTVHERTHTGSKPYKCDICAQSFKRSDHLRSHQKVHAHENDIFICDVCAQVFIYKRHLKKHIVKKHLAT